MRLLNAFRLLPDLVSGERRSRKARYVLIDKIARLSGFRMYGLNVDWFENREFVDAWSDFPDKNNLIHDRRFNLYSLAKGFRHVPGDLAECGVRFGRSSHLMLMAAASTGKHLYGFDSFEGLSTPSEEDGVGAKAQWQWEKHDLSTPEGQAHRNLAAHEGRYTLHRGWIPERFGEVASLTFSFVHVDVDLYDPTRDSYEFFWPRLSPGGAILCDDYGSINSPGARKAADDFAQSVGHEIAELTAGQGLLVKGCG